jgi:hypothetical protein
MCYFTMKAIKEANKEAGQHFFDRSTMRFFKSKIASRRPLGGRFFITSEQQEWNSPRKYTVREALENGSIKTVGSFQGYWSVEEAKQAIKALLKEENNDNC